MTAPSSISSISPYELPPASLNCTTTCRRFFYPNTTVTPQTHSIHVAITAAIVASTLFFWAGVLGARLACQKKNSCQMCALRTDNARTNKVMGTFITIISFSVIFGLTALGAHIGNLRNKGLVECNKACPSQNKN